MISMLSEQQKQRVRAYVARLKPTLAGKFLYYCLPFRKKIVLQNMRLVFADTLNDLEIRKLALSFYGHLFTSLKENIMLRFMSEKQIKQRAVVIGEEHIAHHLGTGGLIITGHVGNWEFAPIAGIMNFKNFRGHFYFVRKMQASKFLEKILFKRYHDAGLRVIPKKNSLMQIFQALENNHFVVQVLDQQASRKDKDAIRVEFFGKKIGTFRSVALIARHSGAPVIPARSYRSVDGKHVLEFFAPLPWQVCPDPQEEIYLNTRRYNQVLENMILDYPEQWLWLYKRWKEKKVPLPDPPPQGEG